VDIEPPSTYADGKPPNWAEMFQEWRTSDIDALMNILRLVLASRYAGPRPVTSPLSEVDPRARGPHSTWPPVASGPR
jgi:hypothetical protein